MIKKTTLADATKDVKFNLGLDVTSYNINNDPQIVFFINKALTTIEDEMGIPERFHKSDIVIKAYQSIYNFPNDIELDNMLSIKVYYAKNWTPLMAGYDTFFENGTSTEDKVSRYTTTYPTHYRIEDSKIKIYPNVAENGTLGSDIEDKNLVLRVEGRRNFQLLVNDTDYFDFDRTLIITLASIYYATRYYPENQTLLSSLWRDFNQRKKAYFNRTISKEFIIPQTRCTTSNDERSFYGYNKSASESRVNYGKN